MKLPSAIAEALITSTMPKPTSAAPWLKANTPSLSTPVAHGRDAAALDEAVEPGEQVLGRAVDLDRRRRRHHVADEPGDVAGGHAIGLAVRLDPAVGEAGTRTTPIIGSRSTAAARASAMPRMIPAATLNTSPADTSTTPSISQVDVLDVVAEVGERLAGRPDRLPGFRAAARHLRLEQVGPQERLHVHPRLRPRDRRVVDHGHAQELERSRAWRRSGTRSTSPVVERVEAAPSR